MKLTPISVYIGVFWLILGKCLLHSSTFKNKISLRNRFKLNFSFPNITARVEGWKYHSDKDKKLTWNEAREWCQKQFTDIAEVYHENVTDYLTKHVPSKDSSPYYWIGLRKNNDTWTWVASGKIVTYQNWGNGEPNNLKTGEDCVEYISNPNKNGKWNDENCKADKYPLCHEGKESELVLQFVHLFQS